jgi:arylsulfatase A-like enzyme
VSRPRRIGSRLAATAATLLALGTGCGHARAPDVVMVVLDTVRADHLGAYGYAPPTSPHLDAFARGADRYTGARASAPWTLPSHASLFTGLAPFEHGAEARFDAKTGVLVDATPLRAELLTLAEALADEGYETRGVVANPVYLGPRSGLSQGFESWDVLPLGGNDWRQVTHKTFERLEARDPARPLFLFVNLMDAHRPYNVSQPGGRIWLQAPDPEDPSALLDELVGAVMGSGASDPDLVKRVVTQYDTGVANADRGLGALLARLREERRFDDALVVVTSDHGEYLGEHGLVEHSKDVYDTALWVPLLLKRPRQQEGRAIEGVVSLTDLPRLVASALPPALGARVAARFPAPAGALPVAELRYTRPKDLLAPYGARFARIRTALYEDGWKLIRSSDAANELYDLRADPGETANRIADQPDRAQRMLARIERETSAREYRGPWPEIAAPSPEERDALRALGYVDAEAATRAAPSGTP